MLLERRDRIDVTLGSEVREALADGLPVVGLESSNIAGGTFPANLDLAHELDDAVRDKGATPARVAVIEGRMQVGLDAEQLEHLAKASDTGKVSNRDLATSLVRGATAGTTVSASLIGAVQAGVPVFAVAGIGGVHRGAETSFDISTDLTQFAESPIAVVCAGAKSLLDPALTLEYLETLGVPVIAYRSDDFAGYLAESSGRRAPLRSDSLHEIARVARRHWRQVSTTSVLVSAPVPADVALDQDELEALVGRALVGAERDGVHGSAVTPYVLGELARATGGRSVVANRAALLSTVELAAELAVVDAGMQARDGGVR